MRAFVFAGLASIVLASIARTAPLSEAYLKNLLAGVRQNRSTQADFREERVIRLMKKPILSSGRIWFQPPNKFRREVAGNSPSVTVSNGGDLWIYYPNFKSAEHYSLGKHSPADVVIAAINTALNLENVEKTFHVTGAKIDNGYALQLLPRSTSVKRMFQKFDLKLNSDLVAERTEMTQPNGDQVVTTYSNQTRATIPAATFEFTPPPGTQITSPLGR